MSFGRGRAPSEGGSLTGRVSLLEIWPGRPCAGRDRGHGFQRVPDLPMECVPDDPRSRADHMPRRSSPGGREAQVSITSFHDSDRLHPTLAGCARGDRTDHDALTKQSLEIDSQRLTESGIGLAHGMQSRPGRLTARHPRRGASSAEATRPHPKRGNGDEPVGARTAVKTETSCSERVFGGRHWTRTSDLLHVKQVL
jgi:hypothetical protein